MQIIFSTLVAIAMAIFLYKKYSKIQSFFWNAKVIEVFEVGSNVLAVITCVFLWTGTLALLWAIMWIFEHTL